MTNIEILIKGSKELGVELKDKDIERFKKNIKNY